MSAQAKGIIGTLGFLGVFLALSLIWPDAAWVGFALGIGLLVGWILGHINGWGTADAYWRATLPDDLIKDVDDIEDEGPHGMKRRVTRAWVRRPPRKSAG